MATWRDRVSESAQEDLDGLLDVALTMAEERLADKGAFYPFALVVNGETGVVDVVGLPYASAPQAQELGYRAVGAMRSQIRAAAVVADVRLPETGGDGIDVFLEHAEGIALGILQPYHLADSEVVPGSLEAHSAQQRIWS
ncbi:hypothetical protein [Nocardia alni]|uniref:hypothetical protein n=1 Tax=Nocardia alni TaxID=2815723 RepID=UPI001C21EF95|nr:hypothetical protein [Nocardia alni]